jgi:hypothetical protein
MSTPDEDLDDTIIRLIEPVVQRSGPMPQPREPVPPPVVRWAVRVRGTTTVVPLDRPVDIGRQPGTSRIHEHTAPRRVVIPDSSGELSARHVRVEQVGDTVVVHDLGSTNGVVVHWARGASRRLRLRESIAVLPDAVITLAEGVELDFVVDSLPAAERNGHD